MAMKWTFSGALLLLTAMGCPSPKVETPKTDLPAEMKEVTPAESSASPTTTTPDQAKPVTLETLDWDSTIGLVKQYPGKIVVMDVWATYCPPCVDEFPNLVKLHQDHSDKIACVSVSADFDGVDGTTAETHREKVQAFLNKQKATFKNVLLSTDTETLFTDKIKHQSIPIVLVFDGEGKLIKEFPDPENPDEFTYKDHVLPYVNQLLGK
ncbi:TlpA family protein disulfide reductase [Planctomicrobium sp. SH527]|uniref:TlpA family protein disulfide reductase n=1 Tax=Planctomicrobium sp. SH527 TaxID=3448123 RepID=UPI003F5C2CC5